MSAETVVLPEDNVMSAILDSGLSPIVEPASVTVMHRFVTKKLELVLIVET